MNKQKDGVENKVIKPCTGYFQASSSGGQNIRRKNRT